jgi:predicted RNA-binding Zn-ribbon protein involved in translation (DUF1610 family)
LSNKIIRLLKEKKLTTYILKANNKMKVQLHVSHKPHISHKIGDVSTQESRALIDILEREDLFEKVVFGNTVACPYCESIDLVINIRCPKCRSLEVEREFVLEHAKCGMVFPAKNLKIFNCPRCGRDIKPDKELRIIGSIFRCPSCGTSFESPDIDLHCNTCDKDFSIREAEIKKIYTYQFREKAEEILDLLYVYSRIYSEIEKLGVKVYLPGTINGESGVKHEFPLVLRAGNDKCLIIDLGGLVSSIDLDGLIRDYIKILDTPQCRYLYVAKDENVNPEIQIPSKLKDYISLIIVKDIDEAIDKVKEYINNLIGEKKR